MSAGVSLKLALQQRAVGIAAASPEEAEAIKKLLFSFEDIEDLSDKARLVLFDQVPTDAVVTSLNGVEGALRELVLSSLAARARRMVEAELSGGPDVPAGDIAEAQRKVAGIALGLIEQGKIQTGKEEDD